MKKTLLFLFLAVVTTAAIQAQGIRYGFKMGVNASSVSNFEFETFNVNGGAQTPAPSEDEDGRINLTAGFFAEIPINETFSIQPEFVFSSQGNQGEGFKTDYLQIPVGLRLNFNKLYVMAGPQVGIKVSFFEQSEDYKSIDFLGFGAIGYHFGENFFIEGRYTLGFAEIFEDDADIPILGPVENGEIDLDTRYRNLSGNNTYISLVVGYRL